MRVPVLRGERVTLRPFEMSDAPRVQQLAGAREVALNTLLIPHPYPDGAAEEWIGLQKQKAEEGHINFAIDAGELVGAIGLVTKKEWGRAEVGYWIGVPFWGRGYATEATGLIIGYGFEHLNLNRIYAGYFSRNRSSGRVMEKNGMKYEGTLRQHVKKWDEYVDIVYHAILRSEWKK
ncbi:MAG TPA: GNAT family protein [Thermoanaerobaculia bacterium]